MTKIIGKDIIPLLISLILMLVSIGIILFTDYYLNYKHSMGFLFILISTVFYFANRKIFIFIFGLTLLIGTFNLIDVFYPNIRFGVGPIMLNPIFLTLLLLFLAVNRKNFDEMFPENQSTERVALDIAEKENWIKHYEEKYQTISESELKKIAKENSGFNETAKIAARNVLNKKYVL